MATAEIPGLTQDFSDQSSIEYYGSRLLVCETITRTDADIIAWALGYKIGPDYTRPLS